MKAERIGLIKTRQASAAGFVTAVTNSMEYLMTVNSLRFCLVFS